MVFPNPTADHIKIKSDYEVKSLHIFAMNGQPVDSHYKTNEISVAHLNPGNYILRINTSKGWTNKKISKIQ